MSFDSSWADAENEVMRALCEATHSVDGKQGFRGFLPPMVNGWALFTGGPGGNEQTTWSPDVVSLHVGARVMAVFARREHALTFAMQAIKALPIRSGNVQEFRLRLGGFGEPRLEMVPVGNEKTLVPAVTIELLCELVFSTGGRAS